MHFSVRGFGCALFVYMKGSKRYEESKTTDSSACGIDDAVVLRRTDGTCGNCTKYGNGGNNDGNAHGNGRNDC